MNTSVKTKNNSTNSFNPWIIGAAVIWAAVIITTAQKLHGTAYLAQILPVLGAGATSCLIILTGIKTKKNQI